MPWLGHFGDFNYGDSGAYYFSLYVSQRSAGPNYLLAQGPADPALERFGSYHPGLCQFVFCDGSVHALRNTIDGDTLGYLAQRNDGHAVDLQD